MEREFVDTESFKGAIYICWEGGGREFEYFRLYIWDDEMILLRLAVWINSYNNDFDLSTFSITWVM